MCEKERLDLILKERFGFSRERGKEAVKKGYVSSEGKVFTKPGEKIFKNISLDIDEKGYLKYVGRGGLKLEKAIEEFSIKIKGKVCIDVGASTGGFTDCMLKYGAEKVFAVDVGTGQLSEVLRKNPKVVSMENTNIVNCRREDFPEDIDFAAADVSFISVTKILFYVKNILNENGEAVILVKPQFEAGKRFAKKGIVRNPLIHKNVIKSVFACISELKLGIKNITFSPVKGSSGNIEYIIYISKTGGIINLAGSDKIIEKIVSQAHRVL